jgi:hypothetical protein
MLDYEYRFDDAPDGQRRASGRFVITFAAPDHPTRNAGAAAGPVTERAP